jgi:hypothetical protein
VQDLSLEFFRAHAGASFSLADSGLALRLATVKQAGMPGYAREQAFSLIFEGPAQPRLEQATLCLRNETAGEFHIFLVPVAADAGATYYEAVFN